MFRLLFFLSFSAICYGEELSAQEVFNRARENVARQLLAVANYTCVLTVDRTLYAEPGRFTAGCAVADRITEKPFMHDRLRLDVAVSEGDEIFFMAWREQVFVRWRNRHREVGTDLIGLVCRLLAQHTLHARRSNQLEQSPKHREALHVPVLCSAQEQRLSYPRKKGRLPRSVPW